jgi:hypothetical protein
VLVDLAVVVQLKSRGGRRRRTLSISRTVWLVHGGIEYSASVELAEGDTIHHMDVAIQVTYYPHQRRLLLDQHENNPSIPISPSWLMHEYYWRWSITYED